MLPQAVEDLPFGTTTAGVTNPELVPAIKVEGRGARDDDHRPGVESKPCTQRFEGALFPAPKQRQDPIPVRRRRARNQRLKPLQGIW